MCYTALDNHVSALECFRNAVKYDDNDAWFWHNYGDALYRIAHIPDDGDDKPDAGLLNEARNALEKALQLDEKHEPSRTLLKKLFEEMG